MCSFFINICLNIKQQQQHSLQIKVAKNLHQKCWKTECSTDCHCNERKAYILVTWRGRDLEVISLSCFTFPLFHTEGEASLHNINRLNEPGNINFALEWLTMTKTSPVFVSKDDLYLQKLNTWRNYKQLLPYWNITYHLCCPRKGFVFHHFSICLPFLLDFCPSPEGIKHNNAHDFQKWQIWSLSRIPIRIIAETELWYT